MSFLSTKNKFCSWFYIILLIRLRNPCLQVIYRILIKNIVVFIYSFKIEIQQTQICQLWKQLALIQVIIFHWETA